MQKLQQDAYAGPAMTFIEGVEWVGDATALTAKEITKFAFVIVGD